MIRLIWLHFIFENIIWFQNVETTNKILWRCSSNDNKLAFFSQENLISRENTLLFERKIVSLRSEIFAIIPTKNQTNIYMQDAVVNKIKSKIAHGKFGEIYFVSSFPQYDVEYVTKLLAIFEREGIISRIAKGVYVKARKTRFGVLYPSAFELVTEIAKRDKAVIIPTGATAANRLGFSTQVPMNTSFLTTGSGRKLSLGNRTVTLKHGAPRNFAFRGKLMQELVQALRSIGENNITKEDEGQIAKLLAETPEKDTIEHDLLLAPVWMRQIIKRNIKGQDNE